MKVLVTGGAGYIGSHTVLELLERKYEVIVYDNLQAGHPESLVGGGKLITGDLLDEEKLSQVMVKENVEAVFHFAADCSVPESVENPIKYFNNNITASIILLNTMKKNNVKKIIFSSSAATYGEPDKIPIDENNNTNPTNPYGETKLMFEKILYWYDHAYGIKYVSLRYFNAAGAHISGKIGEDHNPETHIIPIVLQVALGGREKVNVYGNDYPTPDGTCIRDYIHITDLAMAHILGLDLLAKNKSAIFNLGNGNGFSVKQIIDIAEEVTGKKIKHEFASRRAGDPAVLVASSGRIRKELGWNPQYGDIRKIIETAWNWHKSHPNGYTTKK